MIWAKAGIGILGSFVGALLFMILHAHAGDPKFWTDWCAGKTNCDLAEIRKWFPTVMEPHAPQSCCGEGDAYMIHIRASDGMWIEFEVPDGKGILTDGSVFTVSVRTIQNKYGNPTGSEIAFITASGKVLCVIPDGDV